MGFLAGLAGPLLGAVGSGIAASQAGSPNFQARDNQVNDENFNYGGYTEEERAAQQAEEEARQAEAMAATAGVTGVTSDVVAQARARAQAAREKADASRANARAAGSNVQREANRNEQMGSAAQNREGVQMDTRNIDAARAMDLQARDRAMGAVDMYQAAAEGRGPSAAQAQFQSALDQSNAQQRSLAATAKTGGTQRAELMSQALANAGNATGLAAAQSAALRAQEQQAGMQGYMQGSLGVRQGDAAQQGLGLQQASHQAQLNAQQRALNDQQQQFFEGQRYGVNQQQFQAKQNQEQLNQRGKMAADQVNADMSKAKAQSDYQKAGMVMGGITGGLQGGIQFPGAGGAAPGAPGPAGAPGAGKKPV